MQKIIAIIIIIVLLAVGGWYLYSQQEEGGVVEEENGEVEEVEEDDDREEVSEEDDIVVSDDVGYEHGGGYVFYEDNKRILIATKENLYINGDNSFSWGCYGEALAEEGEPPKLTGIGDGRANTDAIVAADCIEEDNAAVLCDNLVSEGYDDWFLPSKDELNAIYENLREEGIGRLTAAFYLSSTEHSGLYSAMGQSFSLGHQNSMGKGSGNRVRCVRMEQL